ncbi:MAG TPA: hypothetical protein VF407_23070 [Polyangiaceae bacterium]
MKACFALTDRCAEPARIARSLAAAPFSRASFGLVHFAESSLRRSANPGFRMIQMPFDSCARFGRAELAQRLHRESIHDRITK